MKICIVVIDCLRPDHLGCYGYKKKTSPNIDAVARESTLFENAIAQSNWTYPSLYSILTGRYPSSLQLNWFNQRTNKCLPLLPEFLAERGYHTAIFSSFKVLLNSESLARHFKEARYLEINEGTSAVFKDWVKSHRNSFLLFHIGEYVHTPYFADKRYIDNFLEEDLKDKYAERSELVRFITSKDYQAPTKNILRKINMGLIRPTEVDLKNIIAAYDAGIYYVDKFIGKIHKIIREQTEDYLLILMSDHGEAFLEKKSFGHGYDVCDEVIKVPLIFDLGGKHSLRVNQTVRSMDLFPTILELLNFERAFKTDGDSFASVFGGGELNSRIAISEGYPYISIRTDDYKLITTYSKFWGCKDLMKRFGKADVDAVGHMCKKHLLGLVLHFLPDKLYRIKGGKEEMLNLRWKDKQAYQSLRYKLKDILEKILHENLPPDDVELDEEIKKQLEKLGYM